MEGLTSPLQKPPDGGVGAQGLQEFHLAAEGHANALGREFLGWGTGLAGQELEVTRSSVDGRDGDGHVVERPIAWREIIHDGPAL